METIAVVDYSMGNLRSVSKALEHVCTDQQTVLVTNDAENIRAADRVVFPGQGAMRDCMAELHNHGLVDAVREASANKPFLGICMGLQVLLERSEENPDTPGLGIIAGSVKRLPDSATDAATGLRIKIPHMGWNQVEHNTHALWQGIEQNDRFYFVHSYHADPADDAVVSASSEYGIRFCCAVARDNLFAVQFHPEKSQHAGLQLLKNFVAWQP